MYKIDCNNKIFHKNLKELNTEYVNKNINFEIDTVKSFTNYFNKLKK